MPPESRTVWAYVRVGHPKGLVANMGEVTAYRWREDAIRAAETDWETIRGGSSKLAWVQQTHQRVAFAQPHNTTIFYFVYPVFIIDGVVVADDWAVGLLEVISEAE